MARRISLMSSFISGVPSLLLILLLSLLLKAEAQGVSPNPTFDCSNTNFQVIYTACTPNDFSACCAVGSSCCAGGCCDVLSNCLNVGTSNELCCPATDETLCGSDLSSGTTPPYAVQSIICTGAGGLSSYNCPPDATCSYDGMGCVGGSPSSGSGSGSGLASNGTGLSPGGTPTTPDQPVSSSEAPSPSQSFAEPSPTPRESLSMAPAPSSEQSVVTVEQSPVASAPSAEQSVVTVEQSPVVSAAAAPSSKQSVVTVDAPPAVATSVAQQSTVTAAQPSLAAGENPTQRTVTRLPSNAGGPGAIVTGVVTVTGGAAPSDSGSATQQTGEAAHHGARLSTSIEVCGLWLMLTILF